jgi:hypothetical protein
VVDDRRDAAHVRLGLSSMYYYFFYFLKKRRMKKTNIGSGVQFSAQTPRVFLLII